MARTRRNSQLSKILVEGDEYLGVLCCKSDGLVVAGGQFSNRPPIPLRALRARAPASHLARCSYPAGASGSLVADGRFNSLVANDPAGIGEAGEHVFAWAERGLEHRLRDGRSDQRPAHQVPDGGGRLHPGVPGYRRRLRDLGEALHARTRAHRPVPGVTAAGANRPGAGVHEPRHRPLGLRPRHTHWGGSRRRSSRRSIARARAMLRKPQSSLNLATANFTNPALVPLQGESPARLIA